MSDYRESRSSGDYGRSSGDYSRTSSRDYNDGYRSRDHRSSDYRSSDYRTEPSRAPLPTKSMMGSRIYVGKLPPDVRESEVEKIFGKYGKIKEVTMKGNYCFIVRFFYLFLQFQINKNFQGLK